MESLTIVEVRKLGDLESVIESGLRTFAEVGNALLAIRDGRLYRSSHETFEAYCKEKWGMKQTRAYQLMDAAKVTNKLKSSTIVELPANEAQARPLARLEPEEQAEAWKEANDIAETEGRDVTAKDVETVVEERKEKKVKKAPEKQQAFYKDWLELVHQFEIVEDAVKRMKKLNAAIEYKIQARTKCAEMSKLFDDLARKLAQ